MDDDSLDVDVSAALAPAAGAVNRVVQRALGAQPARRPARRLLLVADAATLLLVVGVAVTNRHPLEPPLPPETARPAVHLTNIGDTIVVKNASGGVWLIGRDGHAPDGLPAGTIVVYGAGGSR